LRSDRRPVSRPTHMDGVSSKGCPASASQAKYYLSDQAHCCEFDEGAVIMDMRAVAYLGIDAEHLPNLRACVENWPNSLQSQSGARTDDAASEKLVSDLLARGILTTIPTKAHSLELPRPTTALTNAEGGAALQRIPIAHLLHFCTSLLRVLARHRARRLGSLLGWIRRRQRTIHRNQTSPILQLNSDLLASFFRSRIWFYTAYRHCLFDSLVLSVFLTRRMVPCTLVIGVSTKPFAAHAWVQIDECVLNDTVEHVLTFTPILAIGDSK
jgi:Transglutaminase-like superfamily